MVSEEHQKLLNSLARVLEKKESVTITHLDIDGMPECFDEKYRNLPTPSERDHHIPDLEGKKDSLKHLGEAKISIEGDENLNDQFKIFSNRVMNEKSIPFHIIVPKSLVKDVEKKLEELGLSDKYKAGVISIWS